MKPKKNKLKKILSTLLFSIIQFIKKQISFIAYFTFRSSQSNKFIIKIIPLSKKTIIIYYHLLLNFFQQELHNDLILNFFQYEQSFQIIYKLIFLIYFS